jgi:hypothetical protein
MSRLSEAKSRKPAEYDLDGLFIRIADAVKRVGAKRIVLDTIEFLLGALPNPDIVRAEIHHLFEWPTGRESRVIRNTRRRLAQRPDAMGVPSMSDFLLTPKERIGNIF